MMEKAMNSPKEGNMRAVIFANESIARDLQRQFVFEIPSSSARPFAKV